MAFRYHVVAYVFVSWYSVSGQNALISDKNSVMPNILCTAYSLPIRIGVNISERKSGTERTKKRKKRELVWVFFSPPGGATDTVVHLIDTTRILQPSNRQNTRNITNRYMARSNCNDMFIMLPTSQSFAEHWKLVSESSELHLSA